MPQNNVFRHFNFMSSGPTGRLILMNVAVVAVFYLQKSVWQKRLGAAA